MPTAKLDTGSDLVSKLATGFNALARQVAAGVANVYHTGKAPQNITVLATDGTIARALLIVNNMAVVLYNPLGDKSVNGGVGHFKDAVRHKVAGATTLTATFPATDLTTANALATEIKADLNAHLTEGSGATNVHWNDDATNSVAAADASSQGTLDLLLTELNIDIPAHLGYGADANAFPPFFGENSIDLLR